MRSALLCETLRERSSASFAIACSLVSVGVVNRSNAETSIKKVSAHIVTNCDVINIQSGQLALRYSPNGKSKAGLDNNNYVVLLKKEGIWAYVRVVKGPNSRVDNMLGWVNSNYLSCSTEPID